MDPTSFYDKNFDEDKLNAQVESTKMSYESRSGTAKTTYLLTYLLTLFFYYPKRAISSVICNCISKCDNVITASVKSSCKECKDTVAIEL